MRVNVLITSQGKCVWFLIKHQWAAFIIYYFSSFGLALVIAHRKCVTKAFNSTQPLDILADEIALTFQCLFTIIR